MSSMQTIPLASPDIRPEDIARMTEVVRSGMLVQGKEVLALESALSAYTTAQHACMVTNGTASLHLALLALGIGPDDEVIVPALSYVATANVVEMVGATCVFVDVAADTFNIHADHIPSAISARTKAIMPVHEFGLCADMTQIMEIANGRGIPVVEDAACAIGATHRGQHAGTFGAMGSFSFHPRKSITSGEGGCLVSSDAQVDRQLRILRNHGIDPDASPMAFVGPGLNCRMTDFQAALLNSQLTRLDSTLTYKAALAEVYLNEVTHPMVTLPSVPEHARHSWQTFHLLLESEQQRDRLSAYLREHGIMSNYGAQCIPATPYYARKYGADAAKAYPNAYRAYTCGLAIPLYEKLSKEQIHYISTTINRFN